MEPLPLLVVYLSSFQYTMFLALQLLLLSDEATCAFGMLLNLDPKF